MLTLGFKPGYSGLLPPHISIYVKDSNCSRVKARCSCNSQLRYFEKRLKFQITNTSLYVSVYLFFLSSSLKSSHTVVKCSDRLAGPKHTLRTHLQ